MVDEQLIASLGIADEDAVALLKDAYGADVAGGNMDSLFREQIQDLEPGSILDGKVIGSAGDDFVIDVGLKSEGLIPKNEFDDPTAVKPGDIYKILLVAVEGDDGVIQLSKRKADRIINWQRLLETTKMGDVVEGIVTRKIKGGLLVDIGVPAFLPASQVDVRRPGDMGEFIGREIECKIIKIDESRMNIVVSRRKLIETEREHAKKRLLANVKEGDTVRKGRVKNIADFGAFIDLGGIDGLLHITDMSWGRVNHPSEILSIDQEIEVKILNIDHDKEKIALGLKQKEASPWEEIEKRYPVNSRVKGNGGQHHVLRCLREARGRHRGPRPHLRDVLDAADQPPVRTGQGERRSRRCRP